MDFKDHWHNSWSFHCDSIYFLHFNVNYFDWNHFNVNQLPKNQWICSSGISFSRFFYDILKLLHFYHKMCEYWKCFLWTTSNVESTTKLTNSHFVYGLFVIAVVPTSILFFSPISFVIYGALIGCYTIDDWFLIFPTAWA